MNFWVSPNTAFISLTSPYKFHATGRPSLSFPYTLPSLPNRSWSNSSFMIASMSISARHLSVAASMSAASLTTSVRARTNLARITEPLAEGVVESSTPQIVMEDGVGLMSGYAFSKMLGSCAYGVNVSGDTRQKWSG